MNLSALFLLLVSIISSVTFATPLPMLATSTRALGLADGNGAELARVATGKEAVQPEGIDKRGTQHFLDLYEHPAYLGSYYFWDDSMSFRACLTSSDLGISSIGYYNSQRDDFTCYIFSEAGCSTTLGKRARINSSIRDLREVLHGQFNEAIRSFSCYSRQQQTSTESDDVEELVLHEA